MGIYPYQLAPLLFQLQDCAIQDSAGVRNAGNLLTGRWGWQRSLGCEVYQSHVSLFRCFGGTSCLEVDNNHNPSIPRVMYGKSPVKDGLSGLLELSEVSWKEKSSWSSLGPWSKCVRTSQALMCLAKPDSGIRGLGWWWKQAMLMQPRCYMAVVLGPTKFHLSLTHLYFSIWVVWVKTWYAKQWNHVFTVLCQACFTWQNTGAHVVRCAPSNVMPSSTVWTLDVLGGTLWLFNIAMENVAHS